MMHPNRGFAGQYGAGPKELLFVTLSANPARYDAGRFGRRYIVDYDFLWSGEKGKTWDNICVARRFEKHVIYRTMYDEAGVKTGTKRALHGLVPVEEREVGGTNRLVLNNVTRTATLYETANLSVINALAQW